MFQALLARLIHISKQSCPASLRVIRLQQRCNLDSRKDVRTHLFHLICKLARLVETPLCRMCFLFLHAQRLCDRGETNYNIKMKDLARFSGKPAQTAMPPSPAQVSPQVQLITISDEEADQRIDNFLLRICKGVPKSHIYRVLRSGEVRVNKGRIDQTYPYIQANLSSIPSRYPIATAVQP